MQKSFLATDAKSFTNGAASLDGSSEGAGMQHAMGSKDPTESKHRKMCQYMCFALLLSCLCGGVLKLLVGDFMQVLIQNVVIIYIVLYIFQQGIWDAYWK